jgi:DNA (cytosine-5)-methyltransferase 1
VREPYKLLDLFSGIGGFSLGLERTGGFKTVAFCEMKPHARAVLAKHWPNVRCHDDVTTYEFQEGDADVISAGFPCQDISYAGEGAGLAGARSGLYREVIRAIRLVRPRYAVLENVAALLGRGLATVLRDLAEIGYDAEWHCIPASAVGAPHQRDRIWIIAHTGSQQHEGHRAPFSGALAQELLAANTNADSERELQPEGVKRDERRRVSDVGPQVADAMRNDEQGQFSERFDAQEWEEQRERQARSCCSGDGWWASEPDVGRVAYGVPARVDRLAELGNAVVPKIPEIIGRAILAADEATP